MHCLNAFESVCVHANGDVVCGIMDGRGDYVLGNVHEQSLTAIHQGPRRRALQALVLSTHDAYCRAIGKRCPLKRTPTRLGAPPRPGPIRFLEIEPTTRCQLRCLACLVRDFDRGVGWRDALRDGGPRFFWWDCTRRAKQAGAALARRVVPAIERLRPGPMTAALLRGRIPAGRGGTLDLTTLRRVIEEAGSLVERVDFFNYGEPFLYPHILLALRHVRTVMPAATIALSTNGIGLGDPVESDLVRERLLDYLVFSIDGANGRSYGRYRIGGQFETALQNLIRVHAKAEGTGMNVVWQYVVFRWNDSDVELRNALAMAARLGITIWFDFARSTWGRSRRSGSQLEFLRPFLRPDTRLPDG